MVPGLRSNFRLTPSINPQSADHHNKLFFATRRNYPQCNKWNYDSKLASKYSNFEVTEQQYAMDIVSTNRSRSINLRSTNQSSRSSFTRSNTADYGSLYWTFDPDNHYLSIKWTNFVYSKAVFRTLAISFLPFLLIPAAGAPLWVNTLYLVIMYLVLYLPVGTLIILSFNRQATGFIIQSSEFWIKIVYSATRPILGLILYHQVGRKDTSTFPSEKQWIQYVSLVCQVINTTQIMIIISGMDAIPKLKFKRKVIASIVVAILNTGLALVYQFFAPAKDDYVIQVQATGSEISFHSLLSSITATVAMFIWKQVIDVLRKKDRCTSINYSPYLQWKSETDDIGLTSSIIPETKTVVIQRSQSLALNNQIDHGHPPAAANDHPLRQWSRSVLQGT